MIGIDIVNIKRFEKFLDRFGDKALERFLQPNEISLVNTTQSYAGLYAAKEAISKALGVGISRECSFFDIVIHKDNNKAPYFTLDKKIINKYEIKNLSLSITHDGGFAIAVANIESNITTSNPMCH